MRSHFSPAQSPSRLSLTPPLAQQPKGPCYCMGWLHPWFQSSSFLRRNQDLPVSDLCQVSDGTRPGIYSEVSATLPLTDKKTDAYRDYDACPNPLSQLDCNSNFHYTTSWHDMPSPLPSSWCQTPRPFTGGIPSSLWQMKRCAQATKPMSNRAIPTGGL